MSTGKAPHPQPLSPVGRGEQKRAIGGHYATYLVYAALNNSFVCVSADLEDSAEIPEGLNPLTMSQMASVTSQAKIGITRMAAHDKVCSEMPNILAVLNAKTSGPPTSPSTGMNRGTRRDVYIRYAISTVFTPQTRPGPSSKVQLWNSTRALPRVARVAGSVPAPVMPA